MQNNNLPQVFNYEGNHVRTVEINGEIWFVAKDVCDVLEIDSTATRRLDDDEKMTLRLMQGETNRSSNAIVVNEPGLYSLILGSRKPEAKAFKRWITHEVIPSIRKTGMYAKPKTVEDMMLASAEWQVMAAREMVNIKQRLEVAEKRLETAEDQTNTMVTYLTETPDRAKVNRKIKELARMKFGGNVPRATYFVYTVLKDKYGFDVMQRVKNAKVRINWERREQGLKSYTEKSLAQKVNGMQILELQAQRSV